jgi:hypothetical protein
MESFSSLFNKVHRSELILIILFIIYLILGFNTPEPVSGLVDSLVGKIIIFIIVIYLFMHTNPILAVLGLFVAFDLIRRSSFSSSGLGALQQYAPSEVKKSSQFTAFNQFPYTLEQEVVAKMAPISKSGYSINQASYKPLLDNTHEASPINGSN